MRVNRNTRPMLQSDTASLPLSGRHAVAKAQLVKVSKLALDESNARLGDERQGQEVTRLALARRARKTLIPLAEDILKNGLDPTAPFALTSERALSGFYRVIEGNRRLLVLQVLNDPSIVFEVFDQESERKKLQKLSTLFRQSPIQSVNSVIFESEAEAEHWIIVRHTGANEGVGLVPWNSNDQDRYKNRRNGGAGRKPSGQVLDFVDLFFPSTPGENDRIITTLQRIISTPAVRDKLGIRLDKGKLYTKYPASEVIRGLGKIVRDLRSGEIDVTDVYYVEDRLRYLEGFGVEDLPEPANQLPDETALSELKDASDAGVSTGDPIDSNLPASGEVEKLGDPGEIQTTEPKPEADGNVTLDPSADPGASKPQPWKVGALKPRAFVISPDCPIEIQQPRIESIYRELQSLRVDLYSNACAVMLRVFVELSVDHYIRRHSIISEDEHRRAILASKLKLAAEDLLLKKAIENQLSRAISKIADSKGIFSASVNTFHQYVHNQYAYPSPTELRISWNELEPFVAAVWDNA